MIDSIPVGTPFGILPVSVRRGAQLVEAVRSMRGRMAELVSDGAWDDVVSFGRGCGYPVGDRDDMDSELLITHLCWAYAISEMNA